MILAGFQQLVFSHSLGFSYNRPIRAVCFHTTEGSSVQGAVSVYKNIQACPHMTVDPDTHERFQHVPLDSAAYALRNEKGGCATNSAGVIQIEVVGKAADAWSWSPQRLQWLGEEVLGPILEAYPNIPRTVYSGPRMTCDEWDVWAGGIFGHKDAPENDHWDPGDLDLQRILDYATGDDDMTPQQLGYIRDPDDLNKDVWGHMLLETLDVATNTRTYKWYPAADIERYTHEELKQARLVADYNRTHP